MCIQTHAEGESDWPKTLSYHVKIRYNWMNKVDAFPFVETANYFQIHPHSSTQALGFSLHSICHHFGRSCRYAFCYMPYCAFVCAGCALLVCTVFFII